MYTRQDLLQHIVEDPYYSDDQRLVYLLCKITGNDYISYVPNDISVNQNLLCSIIFEKISEGGSLNSAALQQFLVENKFAIPTGIKSDLPMTGASVTKRIDFPLSFYVAAGELDPSDNYLANPRAWPIYKILFRAIVGECQKSGKVPNARHLFNLLAQYDDDAIIEKPKEHEGFEEEQVVFWTHNKKLKRTTFEDISENRNKLIKKYPYMTLSRF
jgi:hypothetical protein